MPSHNEYARACGELLFCSNCIAAIQVLGNSWDLASSTEVMVEVMDSALKHWFSDVPENQVYDYATHSVHICGPECVKAAK